jgi:transcriptional regulator
VRYTEGAVDLRLKGAPKVYVPRNFKEMDQSYVENFIRKHGFATLISSDDDRPVATHLLLDLPEGTAPSLVLDGHMAKANPQWKTFRDDKEVLAIFSGPHTYVSAGWYSIKSAPTWNYINVHVYGLPRVIDNQEELSELLKRLVDRQEQHNSESTRYRIESLPKDILENMMGSIIGFEIKVTKVEAAAKLSQNRSPKDYDNIIDRLNERGDHESVEVAKEMARRRPRTVSE